MRLQLL